MSEIPLCTCGVKYHRCTEPQHLRFSLRGSDVAHTIALVTRCLDCGGLLGFPDANLALAISEGTEATLNGLATIQAGHPEYYIPDAPERHCHREECRKVYRGPAVYCSFACAMADA